MRTFLGYERRREVGLRTCYDRTVADDLQSLNKFEGHGSRLSPTRAILIVLVASAIVPLSLGAAAFSKGVSEAVAALGGNSEGNRYNLIAAMVRGGQLPGPLTVADCIALLFGTTQGARAASVSELAPRIVSNLSGADSAAILGAPDLLTEGSRYNAIAALARAGRFGPAIGGDAALTLAGSTQGARAAAIGELAPYLNTGLRGVDIASILGTASMLSEGNRFNAIAALGRSARLPRQMSGGDAAQILAGSTQGARASSVGEMATFFKSDLSGQEAATALGTSSQLSEGSRYNAIAALARAGRFGPSIGGDASQVLDGTTEGARAASIGEMARFLRADIRAGQVAAVLGAPDVMHEGNRYNAIAALTRAARVPQGLSGSEAVPILAGTTQGARSASIGELARFFAPGLSGEEVAAVLGINDESTEGNRYNAIAALASAGKLQPHLSGQSLELVLRGTTGQTRTASAAVISSSVANPPSVEASPSANPVRSAPLLGEVPASPGATTAAGSTAPLAAQPKQLPKLSGSDLTDTAEAYEFALLASAVYAGTTPVNLETRAGTISWRQLDRQIQTYPLTNFSLGFKAGTYMRRAGGKGAWLCAIVFAGTDGPEPVDWANNILQSVGTLVPEYEQGAAYAKKMAAGSCRNSTIYLVGHSLGGGIAQYAFAMTQGMYQARTFNSAGLSWMKAPEWKPFSTSTRVINFVAQPYDSSGTRLLGHEPASLTGELIGRRILVPVYSLRAPHLISVLQEGVGIQRDYCLAAGGCL